MWKREGIDQKKLSDVTAKENVDDKEKIVRRRRVGNQEGKRR